MKKSLFVISIALAVALAAVLWLGREQTVDLQTVGVLAGWSREPLERPVSVKGSLTRHDRETRLFDGEIVIQDIYGAEKRTYIMLHDGAYGVMYSYDEGRQLESDELAANVFTDDCENMLIRFQGGELEGLFFAFPAENGLEAAELAERLTRGSALEEVDWLGLFKEE